MDKLATLLERAAAFLGALIEPIGSAERFGGVDDRQETAISAAEVALEHGTALARAKDGFPEELAMSVVKISNALIHLAARLLSRFTGDRGVMLQVDETYIRFQDVMPMVSASRPNG